MSDINSDQYTEHVQELESSEPDRAVRVEELQPFAFKGVVFDLSLVAAVVTVTNPVPVRAGGNVVGHANLTPDGAFVVGSFHLVKACPERLDIESRSGTRYAVPVFEGSVLVAIDIELAPLHSSVPPLGEPIL